MTMISENIDLSVLISSSQSTHKWGNKVWILEQVVVDGEQFLGDASDSEDRIVWRNLKLQIHALHCESYYQNLLSDLPQIYLICKQEEDNGLSPLLITVDFDEANSYMETGELVLISPLPETLCNWLERFFIENYELEAPKKRRRKKWFKAK